MNQYKKFPTPSWMKIDKRRLIATALSAVLLFGSSTVLTPPAYAEPSSVTPQKKITPFYVQNGNTVTVHWFTNVNAEHFEVLVFTDQNKHTPLFNTIIESSESPSLQFTGEYGEGYLIVISPITVNGYGTDIRLSIPPLAIGKPVASVSISPDNDSALIKWFDINSTNEATTDITVIDPKTNQILHSFTSIEGDSLTFPISLTPGQTYEAQLITRIGAEASPTVTINFHTHTLIPEIINLEAIVNNKERSVRLLWGTPSINTGDNNFIYTVNVIENNEKVDTVKLTGNDLLIGQLNENSSYAFQVAAENSAGLGRYASTEDIKIVPRLNTSVNNVNLKVDPFGKATVSWSHYTTPINDNKVVYIVRLLTPSGITKERIIHKGDNETTFQLTQPGKYNATVAVASHNLISTSIISPTAKY